MSRADDLWKLKCSRSIFIGSFYIIMRIKIQQSSRDAVCEVSRDALWVYLHFYNYVDVSRLDLQQQFETVYTGIVVIMLQLHIQMVRNFYNKLIICYIFRLLTSTSDICYMAVVCFGGGTGFRISYSMCGHRLTFICLLQGLQTWLFQSEFGIRAILFLNNNLNILIIAMGLIQSKHFFFFYRVRVSLG